MAEHELHGAAARPTFGDELRREREIRGVSLKEIADSTKVSRRYLDAIERDDFKSLPAPVFTRGFVREYARYLGLDADEMVTRYVHYSHSVDVPELAEQPEPLHSDRVTGEIPRPYARVDRNVWIFLALLVLFIGTVVGIRAWMVHRAEASVTPPATTTIPAAIPAEQEPADPAPHPPPDSSETPASELEPRDRTALPAELLARATGGRGAAG